MKIICSEQSKRRYGAQIEPLNYDILTYSKEDLEKGSYPKEGDILIGALDLQKIDLSEIKGLQYIFLTSVGVDYLDRDLLMEKNITVTNAHGAYDDPIGEWILYGLLQMEKRDRFNLALEREKNWKRRSHSGNIYGKKALFLGTGTIAQEGAKRLQAFKCETVGYNTDGRKLEGFDRCISQKELDQVLPEMDYVIMCLPETDKTYHFIDKKRIDQMKSGVKFVNISRGSTVNEKDLIQGLQEGKIAGAALDVFETEPLPQDSPLWEMEEVYVYPHISFSCEDVKTREARAVIHNLKALLGEGELINVVDFDKGY
ncbi:MAG: NAD(P)-dependent oxidoreductase [Tissierellia bacterium]|nr:NAD(P)-dependent oxidoreductase [Tissierellia bacterium]